jgi:hypothetical protein
MRRTIGVVIAVVLLTVSSSGVAAAARSMKADRGTVPTIDCSTPLRLRDGTNQTGTTVSIYVRGLWINLSSVGFDNRTSSFTVGACPIELAAQSNGNGNHYPSCLFAGCVENVMDPGWNNVVSSVYLH